ncbi:MAG TPA: chemotaxis protein CheA [Clostridiales bacterium]|nr:chemotaxis protein CheA [Clostridiales bacterium]
MDSMLEAYLYEANTLMDQLDGILINCEKAGSFDADSINEIFRIMHTIKGSSAMMQFDSLTTISHKIEDLFAFVRQNGIDKDYFKQLFDLTFKSSDFLRDEISRVENGEPLSNNIGPFEQEINDFLKLISSGQQGGAEQKKAAVGQSGGAGYSVKAFFDEAAQMENLRAYMLVDRISKVCSRFSYYPGDILDNPKAAEIIANEGFDLHFDSKEDLELAVQVISDFIYTKNYKIVESKQESNESGAKQETSQKQQAQPANAQSSPVKQDIISVKLSKLNDLMDIMGEIIITESMLKTIPRAEGTDMEQFDKSFRKLSKLTDDLQEIIMSLRMVPISSGFQRMNRIVRDMSRSLNKDVKLEIIGGDTEVDKTIVDSLADPLIHLVRNAMDHGIEPREERIAAGKPAQGTIRLAAASAGGEILITVEDDGRGLNREAILEKAKQEGRLTKPESEYTTNEIYEFILMPGFSTSQKVTEYSGRGVGMDVVKKNIAKVGGDVIIQSEKGKGTKFVFKIPLTLAILDGMEVSVGKSIFTIPINSIVHSFKPQKEDIIIDSANNEIVKVRESYYPILRLYKAYDIQTDITELEDGMLILIEAGQRPYCLFVDSLIGEQRVVVKSIPEYVKKFGVKNHGIAGFTILGDGSISIILDMARLGNNFGLIRR